MPLRVANRYGFGMEAVEFKIAHLERLYDQLNEVVVEQAKQIHRLETEVRRLSSSLSEVELERIRSTNSKPPHYQ